MKQLQHTIGTVDRRAASYGLRIPIFIDMMGNATRSSVVNALLFSFLIATSISGILIVIFATAPEKQWGAVFLDSPQDNAYYGVPFQPFTVKVEVAATSTPISGVEVEIVAITGATHQLKLRNGIRVRDVDCAALLQDPPNLYENDDKAICLFQVTGSKATTNDKGVANFTNFMFVSGLPGPATLYIQVKKYAGYGVATVTMKSPLVLRTLTLGNVSECSAGKVSFDVSAYLVEDDEQDWSAGYTVPFSVISLDMNGQHLNEVSAKYIDDVLEGKVAYVDNNRFFMQQVYPRLIYTRVTVQVKASSSRWVYLAVHAFGQTAESWEGTYIDKTCTLSGVARVTCSGWVAGSAMVVGQKPKSVLSCKVTGPGDLPLVGKRVFGALTYAGNFKLPPYEIRPEEGTDVQGDISLINEVSAATGADGVAYFPEIAIAPGAPMGTAEITFTADNVISDYKWRGNVVKGWAYANVSQEQCLQAICIIDIATNGGLWPVPPKFQFTSLDGKPVNMQNVVVNVKAGSTPDKIGILYAFDSDGSEGHYSFRDFRFTFCTGIVKPNVASTYTIEFRSDNELIYTTQVSLLASEIEPLVVPPILGPICDVGQACGARAFQTCVAELMDRIGDEHVAECVCRDYIVLCEAQTFATTNNPICAHDVSVARCMSKTGAKCVMDGIKLSYCKYDAMAAQMQFVDCAVILHDDATCAGVDSYMTCANATGNPNDLGCSLARALSCPEAMAACGPDAYANMTYQPTVPDPEDLGERGPTCATLEYVPSPLPTISIGTPGFIQFRALDSLGRPITARQVSAILKVVPNDGILPPAKLQKFTDCPNINNELECKEAVMCYYDADDDTCVFSEDMYTNPYQPATSDTGLITFYDCTIIFGFTGTITIQAQQSTGGGEEVGGKCKSDDIVLSVVQRTNVVSVTQNGDDLVITTDGPALVRPILLRAPRYVQRHYHPKEIPLKTSIVFFAKAETRTVSIAALRSHPGEYHIAVTADGISCARITVVRTRTSMVGTLTPLGNHDLMECASPCAKPCVKDGFGDCSLPFHTPFAIPPRVLLKDTSGGVVVGSRVLAFLEILTFINDGRWDEEEVAYIKEQVPPHTVFNDGKNIRFGALNNHGSFPSTFWCTSDLSDANGVATFSALSFAGAISGTYSLRFVVYNTDTQYVSTLSYKLVLKSALQMTCGDGTDLTGVPGAPVQGVKFTVTHLLKPFEFAYAFAELGDGQSATFIPSRDSPEDDWYFLKKGTLPPLVVGAQSRPGTYQMALAVPGAFCRQTIDISDTIDKLEVKCPSLWIVGSTTVCTVTATRDGVPLSGKLLAVTATLKKPHNTENNETRTGACVNVKLCHMRAGLETMATTNSKGKAKFYIQFDVAPKGDYTLRFSAKALNDGKAPEFDADKTRLEALGFSTDFVATVSKFTNSFTSIGKDFLNSLTAKAKGLLGLPLASQDVDVVVVNNVLRIRIDKGPVIRGSNVIIGGIQPDTDASCSGSKEDKSVNDIVFETITLTLFDLEGDLAAGKAVRIFVTPEKLVVTHNPIRLSDAKGTVTITGLRVTSGVAGTYFLSFSADGTMSPPSEKFVLVDPKRVTATEELRAALLLSFVCMLPLYLANHPRSHIAVTAFGALATAAYAGYRFATFCDSDVAAYFKGDYYNIYVIVSWLMSVGLLVCVSISMFVMVLVYILGYVGPKMPRFKKLSMEDRGRGDIEYVTWITNVRIPHWTRSKVLIAKDALAAEAAEKKQSFILKRLVWDLPVVGFKKSKDIDFVDPRKKPIEVPKHISPITYPNRFTTAMIVCIVFIVVICLVTWNNVDLLSNQIQTLQNRIPKPPADAEQLNALMKGTLMEVFNNLKNQPGPFKKLSGALGNYANAIDYVEMWRYVFVIADEFKQVLHDASVTATVVAMVFVVVHWVLMIRATGPNMVLIRKGELPDIDVMRKNSNLVAAENYIALQMVHFAIGFFIMWFVVLLLAIVIIWKVIRDFVIAKLLVIVLAMLTFAFFWKIFEGLVVKKILTDGLLCRFRGLYSLWAMFNMILAIPGAFMGTIVRWIKGFAFFILFFPRLDFVLYPAIVGKMDSAYGAYWSMLFVEETYNNPTFLVALAHMYQSILKPTTIILPPNALAVYDALYPVVPAPVVVPYPVRTKYKQRWWLFVILQRNPSVRKERKHMLALKEDEDDKKEEKEEPSSYIEMQEKPLGGTRGKMSVSGPPTVLEQPLLKKAYQHPMDDPEIMNML